MITEVWECERCGRDNEGLSCILCGLVRGVATASEDESARAAELIREAEAEFSRQLGMPVSLKIHGRPAPDNIEEARALIDEMRAELREQLAEESRGLRAEAEGA